MLAGAEQNLATSPVVAVIVIVSLLVALVGEQWLSGRRKR